MTFLVVALVVIAAPGPDFVLTVRNTAMRGRRAGVATALGVVAGQTVWSLAAHGVAFALLTLGWLCLVACAGAALRTPAVRRAVAAVSGVVLVALGFHLAVERR